MQENMSLWGEMDPSYGGKGEAELVLFYLWRMICLGSTGDSHYKTGLGLIELLQHR